MLISAYEIFVVLQVDQSNIDTVVNIIVKNEQSREEIMPHIRALLREIAKTREPIKETIERELPQDVIQKLKATFPKIKCPSVLYEGNSRYGSCVQSAQTFYDVNEKSCSSKHRTG